MAEALTSFHARCSARGLSQGTRAFCGPRLESFRCYLEEQVPGAGPAQVDAALVRGFLQVERERTSAMGAHHARATLNVFFSHLVREGLVATNPVAKVERVKARQKLVRPPTSAGATGGRGKAEGVDDDLDRPAVRGRLAPEEPEVEMHRHGLL